MVKETKISENDCLFVVSSQGIWAIESSGQNEGKLLGWSDPKDIVSAIQNSMPLSSGLIPPECIYFERRHVHGETQHKFLFQFQPGLKSIKHTNVRITTVYNLAFPFLYFVIVIRETTQGMIPHHEKCYLFCTNKPIESLDDKIFDLPINNLYQGEGRICWGDNPIKISNNETPVQIARRICDYFFELNFNNDLMPDPVEGIVSYAGWQEESLKNPSFILNLKFKTNSCYKTLRKLLEQA